MAARSDLSARCVPSCLGRMHIDGLELDPRDALLVYESMQMREALLQDLGVSPNAFRRASHSISELDAKAYFTDWKLLRQKVISPEFRSQEDPLAAFQQLRGVVHYKWTVTPLAHLRCEDRVNSYRTVLQWVSFDSKLNLRFVDYRPVLYDEYLEDEKSLRESVLPDSIRKLAFIAEHKDANFCPELVPYGFRFTGGATREFARSKASPRNKVGKAEYTADTAEYDALRTSIDHNEISWLSPSWTLCTGELPMVVDFVPKSPLTNRVISKEPTSKMYIQSDCREILEAWIEHSGLQIHLHNQEYSRFMALRGSRDGSYATIDLSKASDSVTLAHIVAIFSNTSLHQYLMLSRSKWATVADGHGREVTLRLSKFAPMGSNTCFPTESIVFALVCELAIALCRGYVGATEGLYLVYGDDICVHKKYAETVIRLLTEFNFIVNEDKSFTDSAPLIFREACGIECVNGVDITPLRIPRFYTGVYNVCNTLHRQAGVPFSVPSPGEAIGCIEFANRCMDYGYPALRKLIIQRLSQSGAWFKKLRFLDHTDAIIDRQRIQRGLPVEAYWPSPTVVTYDGCATNYQTDVRITRHSAKQFEKLAGQPTWLHCRKTLYATAVPNHKDAKDSLDYFVYWCNANTRKAVSREFPSGRTSKVTLKWAYRYIPIS